MLVLPLSFSGTDPLQPQELGSVRRRPLVRPTYRSLPLGQGKLGDPPPWFKHTAASKGADANLKNDGGRTALHYAASKGWVKIAELLLSHGANINAKDKVGCTPLLRAANTGNSELCELLIEEGADIDALDKADQTPLMNAVICENGQVALLLVRHGADVDMEDKEGYTVLGRAPKDLLLSLCMNIV